MAADFEERSIQEGDTQPQADLIPKFDLKEKIRKYYAIVLIVLLLIPAILLLLNYVDGNSQVVAEVNGEKITREELYQAMLLKTGRETLDHIILKRLVAQEAKKQGIVVSEDEVTAEVDLLIAESFNGMKEMFLMALEDYGLTEERVREDLTIELLLRKLAEKQIDITDADAREYFNANRASFDQPEEVEARHILVETREIAQEVMQQLQNGKDFAELAGEYSKDTYSAMQGGSLGYFQRGMMVSEFDEVAFSLAKGGRSDIVQTMHGYHIVEVLDRREARQVTYEEVEGQVRERMSQELLSQKMNGLMETLWEGAKVDYRI